jgi:hypothetical protein
MNARGISQHFARKCTSIPIIELKQIANDYGLTGCFIDGCRSMHTPESFTKNRAKHLKTHKQTTESIQETATIDPAQTPHIIDLGLPSISEAFPYNDPFSFALATNILYFG